MPDPTLPPGDGKKDRTILQIIYDWYMSLPFWVRAVLFLIGLAILIAMIYKILKHLFSGDPEDPESFPPQVVPIEIAFNYDPTSPVSLNIRKNYKEDVYVPEWSFNDILPEESPAAYSIAAVNGRVITIKVKLIIVPAITATVEVRATGGGVLGDATRKEFVNFVNGVTIPEFINFNLENHTIGNDGVRKSDCGWRWEFRFPGEEAWSIIGTTKHRIYEVLNVPGLPWLDAPYPDNQNVWTEVLDIACVWAAGCKTQAEVAKSVTIAVNAPAGNIAYDMDAGACKYTSGSDDLPGEFKCTEYLDRLRKGDGSAFSKIVNCSDCATFVSTFANAVGATLSQSVMGYQFELNQIIAIGYSDFGYPNWGPGFSYHEVAWWGNAREGDQVCDACLHTNSEGPNAPGNAVLHANAVFSDPFRTQLVPPWDHTCQPQPGLRKWRKVT
jgi:hypothetical protein